MKTRNPAPKNPEIPQDLQALSQVGLDLLTHLGEDPKREGLTRTPMRFGKAMKFLTSGYEMSPKDVVGQGIFKAEASEMVFVRDIEFYSMCEHHVLPFFGRAHIAYLPNEKIIGLSKIPRIVDVFARRLQVQERLTAQIGKTLYELLEPHGVAVVIEASHMCMMMRGVEKQGGRTFTSKLLGEFHDNSKTRKEFFDLLRTRG